MGFPPQFFTVLFALPRVTGYLSHWREQLSDPDVKIARPQQNYTVRAVPLYLTLLPVEPLLQAAKNTLRNEMLPFHCCQPDVGYKHP